MPARSGSCRSPRTSASRSCRRAGASTLAELTYAGRPAILIPLPSAMDDHQTANAREMTEAGGARTIPQARFTAVELAKQMQKMAQIGRASVRERVCQYVKISVVAGSLKTKTTNIMDNNSNKELLQELI